MEKKLNTIKSLKITYKLKGRAISKDLEKDLKDIFTKNYKMEFVGSGTDKETRERDLYFWEANPEIEYLKNEEGKEKMQVGETTPYLADELAKERKGLLRQLEMTVLVGEKLALSGENVVDWPERIRSFIKNHEK